MKEAVSISFESPSLSPTFTAGPGFDATVRLMSAFEHTLNTVPALLRKHEEAEPILSQNTERATTVEAERKVR